jgi:hypothetical protein
MEEIEENHKKMEALKAIHKEKAIINMKKSGLIKEFNESRKFEIFPIEYFGQPSIDVNFHKQEYQKYEACRGIFRFLKDKLIRFITDATEIQLVDGANLLLSPKFKGIRIPANKKKEFDNFIKKDLLPNKNILKIIVLNIGSSNFDHTQLYIYGEYEEYNGNIIIYIYVNTFSITPENLRLNSDKELYDMYHDLDDILLLALERYICETRDNKDMMCKIKTENKYKGLKRHLGIVFNNRGPIAGRRPTASASFNSRGPIAGRRPTASASFNSRGPTASVSFNSRGSTASASFNSNTRFTDPESNNIVSHVTKANGTSVNTYKSGKIVRKYPNGTIGTSYP